MRGPDWEQLVEVSQEHDGRSCARPGMVVDLDTDYQLGMPELRIFPDRARAADLGVSMEDVATTHQRPGGRRPGRQVHAGGRRIDVRLRLLADQRSRPEDLSRLQVRTAAGELVPLSVAGPTEERPALQAITRRDRERAITVFANVAPGHAQDEALAVVERLAADLPVGTRAVLGGASVAFRESMGSLLFALFLGIIVAYMVLASQFNSFLHPVTVLTILPLSVAGAAFALLARRQEPQHLQHDRPAAADGHREEELDHPGRLRQSAAANAASAALRAMPQAGPVRLRPILMTSIATMMAAVPPALGLGAGQRDRASRWPSPSSAA